LSGGVDSCISAIVLKDILGKNKVDCATFSTLNAEQDEFNEAKYTADHLGLEIERVVVDPNKQVDLEELILNSNFFYPGSIMISAIAKQLGTNHNFFACQDTRLHTPALNQLDKIVFKMSKTQRDLLSKLSGLAPKGILKDDFLGKVIKRSSIANDLPKYINELFFHKHNIKLGEYSPDSVFTTDINYCTEKEFGSGGGTSREIYNKIVTLAWHRQYSDDIQYLISTTNTFGSSCQLPWYDKELAVLSARLPMKEATKFVKGRAGHSQKVKKVNKYLLRNAFDGLLPDEILFRDKAVCVTNHLYLKGVYRPYIEGMRINSHLFNTESGRNLSIEKLFSHHYDKYLSYGVDDYNAVVEMQNIVALELYCKVFKLS
jgi:hypothetical protein